MIGTWRRQVAGAAVVLACLSGALGGIATHAYAQDAATDDPDGFTQEPLAVVVDDPLIDLQWHLERTNVRTAWGLTQGSAEVTVAVVDTGVDPAHLDLAGAFWRDPISGANGYDHLLQRRLTYVGPVEDWHGTAVAGVVAARADDGYGMAGVAPGVRLMVHRIYASTTPDEPPSLTGYADAAVAIRSAADAGADVILLTWGGTVPNTELFDAIAQAGVPVVAAAGNDGQDLSSASASPRRYPAGYLLPNLVTVAASDADDNLLDNERIASNFGVRHVDLAAPGERIVSLQAGGIHRYFEGTSFAAPQVAGALALGRSLAPAVSAEELVAQLVSSVRRVPGLSEQVISGGVLDVAAFLRAIERPVCTPDIPPAAYLDVSVRSVHIANIDCITWYGVSRGTGDGRFLPGRVTTRGEMAAFLARTLEVAGYVGDASEPQPVDDEGVPLPAFTDIGGHLHEEAIAVVAAAGIAQGRADGTFAPAEAVTRGQMASFVTRTVALLTDLTFSPQRTWFDDIEGSVHEDAIITARDLGITQGSATPRLFEPDRAMTRAQLASFLARTLDASGRQGVEMRRL